MEVVSIIGGAILSASLQGLFDKLSSHDLLNYASRARVKTEINKWESMLKKLYVVLDDAEEKQVTNRLVKIWVSELRDLAYDVEDVVDEFASKSLRKKHKLSCARTIKFNVKLVSKMEGITARLKKICESRNELDLRECVGGGIIQTGVRQPTTSLVNEGKVYGREKDRKAILAMLQSEVSAAISVIAIVGMGGIGKTTLAQLIFNDSNLKFDMKFWVSVGEVFDVIGITRTVLQLDCSDDKDLDFLQVKLKENLSGNKFLLVLDDVWSENYDDWTLFLSPFEAGAPGSRIIITTRNQGVSLMMAAAPAYPLKELSNDDCLAVFSQHALRAKGFEEHLILEEIGKQIVERCQGSPLAAKALGGLLRGKLNPYVWEKVLNSRIWDLPDDKTGIFPALMLSYHHLPSHLKRCFAYCAIFPKDYKFDKNELVLLWMAEGFLQQPNEQLGHEYFLDLLSRSFFQQSSSDKSKYVMHNLITDLARCVNDEICFHSDDKLKGTTSNAKVRHLSFSRHICDTSQKFEAFHEMKNLRTFLALPILPSSFHQLSSKVLHELVPKLRFLMVLSLAGYCIKELPSSIGSLKHLRYLNLSCTEVTWLPETICELFNLQTLKLCGCWKLIRLPIGITNLVNLQYLDISDTDSLLEMPPRIGNLTNLRILPKFIIGNGHGLGITELTKLSHLRRDVHILGLHNVLNSRDSELVNLKEKRDVDALVLEWTNQFYNLRNETNELQVLSSLQPHRCIESISIKFYGGTRFPFWIGDPQFNKIKHIELYNCRKVRSLPSLGQLPLLKKLSIVGMDGVKEVDVNFFGVSSSPAKGFPSLETLTMKNMVNWEHWQCEESEQLFSNLRELELRNCPKLVGKLPKLFFFLKYLNICGCPRLAELPEVLPSLSKLNVEKCNEMILKGANDLFSLRTLKMKEISGLVSLHEVIAGALMALENLEIVGCQELIHVWRDGSGAETLANMRRLRIENNNQLVSLVGGEEELLPCNLEVLIIEKCENLNKLPNGLHSLASLRYLRISNCPKVVAFPPTGLPYFLRHLKIMDCDSLVSLPDGVVSYGNNTNVMSHLKNFAIEGCSSLTSFPIGQFPESVKTLTTCYFTKQQLEIQHNSLQYLIYLEIKDCYELDWFPEDGLAIPTLTYLTISSCKKLKCLPSRMNKLMSLSYLEIHDCGGMESFPEDGLPPNLTTFRIKDCKNLRQPISDWGLHTLTSLKRLAIKGASPSTDVISFPHADGTLLPSCLTFVWIDGLKNLKCITKGINSLNSLENLWIWNCPKLSSLPKKGLPATLGFLEILACPRLKPRCVNRKGDYWPIVSHIPCVAIDSMMSDMPLNPFFYVVLLVTNLGSCLTAMPSTMRFKKHPILVLQQLSSISLICSDNWSFKNLKKDSEVSIKQ